MSSPAPKLRNNWPINYKDSELFLGKNIFQKMIAHMMIRLDMVKDVNERLGKYVKSGRHVSLDEKHKGCQKDQYLSRWVHGKDPNWGHWITELTTIAPKSGMPILLKLMPLTSTEPKNVTIEPYNNFNLIEVHQELSTHIREGTLIVEDAYYLDDNSRTFLREKNIPYLSAINPVRFEEIWKVAKEYVSKKGEWVILYNEETEEHAMMRWDPIGERKQYVLTNVFQNRDKINKKAIDNNTISDVYKLLFNGCDRYNNYLSSRYWPYRREGWQSNFDDFFFSAFGLNLYVMYHEIVDLSDEKI
jgi:hypothetical protein